MNTLTLRQQFNEFVECVGQSESNVKNYKTRLRVFLHKHGHCEPKEITRSHINKWYQQLVDSGDFRPVTLSGYRQAIKGFFNWLIENGNVDINVAKHVKAGRFITPNPKSRCPKEDDVKKVTEIAKEWLTSEFASKRRAACFWFWSLEGGGRVGGTCNMRLEEYLRGRDFPDENGIYQFTTWSKGKEVIFEVTEKTITATNAWLEVRPESDRKELMTTIWARRFPINRVVTEQACKDFKQLSQAAGLSHYITSHMLRHRLGTILTQRFDPKIAAMKLCHADAHTTAQTAIAYYYRPDRSEVSRATAMLANL